MENTLIGKTEILTEIYCKAAHLKAQNAPLSVVSTKTNLDKLLKLQLANLYQDHEHVIEVIKTETPFLLNRALSYKWFFKDASKYVANFDYSEQYLLPNVSCLTRRKLLERLNSHLENEIIGDKYFTSILLRYGIGDAATMLPSCSINLITSILNDWQILLTCKQLLAIYNKSRPLAVDYLNTFTINFCRKTKGASRKIGLLKTYNKVFKQLFIDDTISFMNIYKQFCNYYGKEFHLYIVNNKRMKLNKKSTRYLLTANPQFATANIEISFELLYLEMLFELLSIHDFTIFCSSCLPSNVEDIKWDKIYLLLTKMKADEKFKFIKSVYESKYGTEILTNHNFNNSKWFKVIPSDVKIALLNKYSTEIENLPLSFSVNIAILLLQNAYDMNKHITHKCILLEFLRKCVANKGSTENLITKFIFELCAKRNWEIVKHEGQTEVKIKMIELLAETGCEKLMSIIDHGNVVYSRKFQWPGHNGINRDYIENQIKFFVTNNLPVETELIFSLVYRQMNYYSHNLIDHNNCKKLDQQVFATLLQLYADCIQEINSKETVELLLASLTVFLFGKIWHKHLTLCDYPPIVEQILQNFHSLQKSDSDLLFKWIKIDKKARMALPNMIFELRWSKGNKLDKLYVLEYILNNQPSLLLTLELKTLIYYNSRRLGPNYRNFLTKVMLLHNATIGNHIIKMCRDELDEALPRCHWYSDNIEPFFQIQRLVQDRREYLTFFWEYLEKITKVDSYRLIEIILSSYSESDLNNLIKNKVFFQTHSRVIPTYCKAVLKTHNGYRIVVDVYNDEAYHNKIRDSIIPHIIWYCVRNVVPNYKHCSTIKDFFNNVHENCRNSRTHNKIVSLVTRIADHSLFTFELELIDIATNYLVEFKETKMEEKCSITKYLGLCLHLTISNKLHEDNLNLIRALVKCLLYQCDICYECDNSAVLFIQQVVEYLILFSLAASRHNLSQLLLAIKSNLNAGDTANTELFMYISIWMDILTLYFKLDKELKLTRCNANEKLESAWREFGKKCGLYFEEQSALHADEFSDMYRDALYEVVVFLGKHCVDVDIKLPQNCREVFVKGLTGSMKGDMEFYFKIFY